MAFKITVTIEQPGQQDKIEEHIISRQAFVAPALAKLKSQHESGKKYTYVTTEVQ